VLREISMYPWVEELRKHWPSLRWPVFLALVIGAIGGFGAATFWWSGTVSTLRERVALLEENRSHAPLHIVEVKSGPSYRVKPSDDVIQVNNPDASPITIFLPSGFERGKLVTVKDKRGNANAVNIKIVSDAGTIDGLRELVINSNKGYYLLIWDGEAWSMN
jgi:hypothetical protein